MKITFITSGSIYSSLSYRPLALAKELVKKGHYVSIIAPLFDKYSNFIDEGITEIEGIKIIRPMQIKKISFELGLIPYIASSVYHVLRINPDVIHINKPNPITISGLFAKFFRHTSIVLDVDDLDAEVMRIEKNSLLKVKLVELSEKILANYANAIIVGSQYLKALYEKSNKNKKIFYAPNGAEFSNKVTVPKVNNLSQRIVFIGNLNRKSILEPLFIALSKLKEVKIIPETWIIGSGSYLKFFKNLSKNLELENSITFFGHVSRNELGKYVKAGDIGYSYMPNEETVKACSSMKVFQYMQYGAVPVVSNVGDLPFYAFLGKAGYVAKHSNIDSLTSTIRIALVSKQDRKDKLLYALQHAEKKYSWRVIANTIEQTYKNIV